MKSIPLCSLIFLLCQAARGLQLPFGEHFHFDDTLYPSTQKVSEEPDIFAPGSLDNSTAEEHRTENGSVLQREEILNSSESTVTDDGQSSTISPDTTTSRAAAVSANESQSQNLTQLTSAILPSTYDGVGQDVDASNVTVSANAAEEEKVARGKPPTTESGVMTPQPQSLYQKTWTLISDTYTLSILVPVAAGVVFATTVILMIAFCRCLRKCCLRRRLRKKVLPDSVKNLRPSDRARLLAESSDDEF